ncbi:MAG: hypothetical protein ACYDH9_21915 [Limisphaerales bacterium]
MTHRNKTDRQYKLNNSFDAALVTGDGDWDQPGQLKFWHPSTGELLARVSTSGEVLALACSPDGWRIAVGCGSKKLEVWEVPEAVAPRP